MLENQIELKVRELPDEVKRQVFDYVDFLLNKYPTKQNTQNKFKFNWEGKLSDKKEEFTSVELQHQASEWR